MTDNPRRVVLITGASCGIGLACAQHLHRLGHRVYGTSRRAPEAFDTEFGMVRMELADEDSVNGAVETVLRREGRIDVLFNNAGMLLAGAIEDTSPEEARREFEVNFLGMLRTCRAVLPAMRAQGSGLIVNMSSIAGRVGVPFQGMYAATKHAVEGFSEALRFEVRPFGIHVVLLTPGDVRTNPGERRVWTAAAAREDSPYAARARRTLGIMEADEAQGAAPESVARTLERVIASPSPAARYVPGPLWERVALALKYLVPYGFFEWGVAKYYRLR